MKNCDALMNVIGSIANARMTPMRYKNAVALLYACKGEILYTTPAELARLFGVSARSTVRSYLSDLQAAGVINYTLLQDSAIVFFLASDAAVALRYETPQYRSAAGAPTEGDSAARDSNAPWYNNATV